MSSAWAAVRFPDGEVRHTVYHGTSDVLSDRLFDDAESAWDAFKLRSEPWPRETPDDTDQFDVEIYSDYGGGFWWRGRATKARVIDGCIPHGMDGAYGSAGIDPLEMHREQPTWATYKRRSDD